MSHNNLSEYYDTLTHYQNITEDKKIIEWAEMNNFKVSSACADNLFIGGCGVKLKFPFVQVDLRPIYRVKFLAFYIESCAKQVFFSLRQVCYHLMM